MLNFLSLTIRLIFLSLALLHLYWVLGGQIGLTAVIPVANNRPLFKPTPLITSGVIIALFTAALLVFSNLYRFLPAWLTLGGTLGLALIFLLRALGEFHYVGFFKRIKDTAFARNDTLIYSPLCLFLSLSCFLIAFGSQP